MMDPTHIDPTEYYRQRVARLRTEQAWALGALVGLVAAYLSLLVWEVVGR